jgi:hypothetical protein
MATTKIIVPDFEMSGFYYAEILQRIRLYDRIYAPEITSEVAEEPFIQLERAFALVGHLNNVLLDLAANENLLPTAKLQDSVRLLLKLIDFQLRDYSPSTVELLVELTQVMTVSTRLVDENSLYETEREDDTDPIPFENLTAIDIGPTDEVDGVFGLEKDREGTDGSTVVGDPDAFESAAMAVSSGDLRKEIEITGSILGNNGTFRIAEILQTGATSRIRLEGILGGETPLFLYEPDLIWKIRTYTSNGASDVNTAGAPFFSPWANVDVGDKFYFGSSHVMWDRMDFVFTGATADFTGIWEYYDPDFGDESPDNITNLGTQLQFDITSLLGNNNLSNSMIKVTYLPTGISELLPSTWIGPGNVVTTSAFLGQSGTPSLKVQDYSVGTDWNPFLSFITDEVGALDTSGKIEFTLPQTTSKNWQKLEVEGVNGFYIRYRVLTATPGNEPEIDTIKIDEGSQYTLIDAVQGETVKNESLVSSNGQPDQEFELQTTPGLRDTVECFVDEGGGEVEWTNLTADEKTLYNSGSKDRHFEVSQNSLGVLTVLFGDGTRGKIPPLGTDNVRFVYRINANEDGNVGASTITVNAGGAAYIKNITNPRPAGGWREADGVSNESLALVKEEGPASLRTGNRACAPQDYEDLALAFTTTAGTRPIVRASAIEEGYGPKTIMLVVVGTNGVAIPNSVKDELEDYFNGNESEGIEGVGQANVQTTVVNFTPRLIPISVTIQANSALTETLVETQLAALLNPTAREEDGIQFVWQFGGRIPLSRIVADIFRISPGNIFDVDISIPSEDNTLLDVELPILDNNNL